MKIPDLLAALPEAARQAAPEDLPALLGKLAEAEAVVRMRIAATTPTATGSTNGEEEADRLLTLPEVAEIVGVPVAYVYTLARQRKIPTVRPPGLEKEGRTCSPKYVRVKRSSLTEWIAKLDEDKGLDSRVSATLRSLHDRKRGPATAKATRDDAGRVRRPAGRPPHHGEQVGDGRNGDQADGSEAHQAPGGSAAEG